MTERTTFPLRIREVTKAPHSEVHIRAVIPPETLAEARPRALERLAKTVVVDGFRPGKVPPEIAQKHLSEQEITQESVRLAVEPLLPSLLEEHAPRAVATPRVFLENETPTEEGVAITIVVPVYPEITLPDYRAIARRIVSGSNESEEAASEEEAFERALTLLRKEHALKTRKELNPDDTSTIEDIKEEDLPPLTDEIAKALGPFQTVEELKEALRKDINAYIAGERTAASREALLETLVKETDFEVPLVFVEMELMRIMEEVALQLAATGKTPQQFLESLEEAQREELLRSWQETATQRVKAQLILEAIAQAEGVEAPEEELRARVDKVMASNPSLRRQEVEAFVRQQLRNEAVFRLLLGGGSSNQENTEETSSKAASGVAKEDNAA